MSCSPSQSSAAAAAAAYGCCQRILLASTSLPATGRPARLGLKLRSTHSLQIRNRRFVCQAMTETEPDGDGNGDEVEKEELGGDASSPSVDSVTQENGSAESETNADNTKDETVNTEPLSSSDTVQNIDGDATPASDAQENVEVVDVAVGSPLPGMKQQLDESVRIPKATIDILKDQVFGFDTFFVTSQEPYEGGILFKGNLRGQPAKSYEKITNRLQDDKPVAVVVPRQTLQPETTAVPEWFAAASFGVVTIFTLLLRNVPLLQDNLLSTFDNLELLKDGVYGALVTAAIIGVHEIAHILAARDTGIKLAVPYFVPSWQLILGDALKEGTKLSINPLVLWAWAGLLINAINSIPAGELDGGRIAFAMWGRKISSRISSLAIGLLGISALFNDVAFYWVVLIFFLQRGPISPLSEEITEPENNYISIGVAILLFGLLVCLPYPFPFDPSQLTDFDL
uniref:Peptidase M50 domain-containing protein n=1 Tax=Oryza glumipatula TaxID=40148 RepID=A0A0D9Y332_9ORYZ